MLQINKELLYVERNNGEGKIEMNPIRETATNFVSASTPTATANADNVQRQMSSQ
jgi:hypothetical protein